MEWPAERFCDQDVIDTGGHASSLRATIANIESYELRLLSYRRRDDEPD
jgi:hypothetical protein